MDPKTKMQLVKYRVGPTGAQRPKSWYLRIYLVKLDPNSLAVIIIPN